MIELYNEDNIKIYVDSTGYYIAPGILNSALLLADKNGNEIVSLLNRKTQGLIIIIKGNTITLEGIMLDCIIKDRGYNVTLKGNIEAWLTQEDSGPNVYTYSLYGSSRIRIAANGLTRHNYILHDSAYLILIDTGSADIDTGSVDTCEVFAYDNSTVLTHTGCTVIIYDTAEVRTSTSDAKIYAYDNSTVLSADGENIHLFDNATNINYI